MIDLTNITNSQIAYIIDEYCHVQKYRDLLKRRYIDGIVYETLAEEFDLSVVQTKRIVYKQSEIIFKHLS